MRNDGSGFTLIETLGAVLLFAIAMTFITIAQSDGAAHAGDAVRRADASLYAEQLIVELEEAAAAGAAPTAGRRELSEERGGTEYSALVEVAPLDAAKLGLSLGPPPAAPGRPRTEAEHQEGGLFAANAPTPAVYQVQIRVSWSEGAAEREVTRASFLLNPAALEALAPAAAEEPEE
jgi:hypothetical protein